MKFIKRLTEPSNDNKYYIKAGKGGYNRAMEIDKNTHSCLPNCCGLAHARWMESQGQTDYSKYDKLSIGDAENYYLKNDGYKRGLTPKLGAIICWRKGETGNGSDGHGHVAFVEKINDDGSIVTSNSAYGGSKFYIKTLQAPNYYMGSAYTFQGFIYPDVEFEEEQEKPIEPTKFNIGDKVIINGKLYKSSNAEEHSGYVTDKETTITRIAENAKHPYNTTGDLGWMDESSIKLISKENIYIVKEGDNLSSIAEKYNTTWQKIYEDNKSVIGDNPNLILPNTKLIIK